MTMKMIMKILISIRHNRNGFKPSIRPNRMKRKCC